jgi:hypothetical protein
MHVQFKHSYKTSIATREFHLSYIYVRFSTSVFRASDLANPKLHRTQSIHMQLYSPRLIMKETRFMIHASCINCNARNQMEIYQTSWDINISLIHCRRFIEAYHKNPFILQLYTEVQQNCRSKLELARGGEWTRKMTVWYNKAV